MKEPWAAATKPIELFCILPNLHYICIALILKVENSRQ